MEKPESFIPQNLSYPPTYDIEIVNSSEFKNILADEILGSAPFSGVQECMTRYVTSYIEPRDWRAIWRTSRFGGNLNGNLSVVDFIVEVLDVSHNALEAHVSIEKLLHPGLGGDCSVQESFGICQVISQKRIDVPLTELHVIMDDGGEYFTTAQVIEHVKFFYKHIWRPWDDIVDRCPSRSFALAYLPDRLNLYFEMKIGLVRQSIVDRVNYLLDEGTRLKARFDEVNQKMESADSKLEEDSGTDEEIAVNDIDLTEALRLKMKAENLDLEMRRLEDPLLRRIVMIVDPPAESADFEKVHIVAVTYKPPMLETIMSFLKANPNIGNDSSFLEFHQNLPSAFASSRSGDKVLIMPGTYACATTLWITGDISILGVSSNKEDVVLESDDPTGEIFLHCAANEVNISNVTLRTTDPSHGILQVHFGHTYLKDCIVDGGQCRTSLSGKLHLTGCVVPHLFTLNESESAIVVTSSNLRDSLVCSRHST